MAPYFSQKEFAAMCAEIVDVAAVKWLALGGKPLTPGQTQKLDQEIAEFFRTTGHRSFQQHHQETRSDS